MTSISHHLTSTMGLCTNMKWFKRKPEAKQGDNKPKEAELSPFEKYEQHYLDTYKNCSDNMKFHVTITLDSGHQIKITRNKTTVVWILACFADKNVCGLTYDELSHEHDVAIDFSKVTDIFIEKIEDEELETDGGL